MYVLMQCSFIFRPWTLDAKACMFDLKFGMYANKSGPEPDSEIWISKSTTFPPKKAWMFDRFLAGFWQVLAKFGGGCWQVWGRFGADCWVYVGFVFVILGSFSEVFGRKGLKYKNV